MALVGFLLAILAWPGFGSRSRAILEWEATLAVLRDRAALRPRPTRSTPTTVARRTGGMDLHWGQHMLAGLVPTFFAVVWAVLAAVSVSSPATGR